MVDFKGVNLDLAGIGKFLNSSDVNLSDNEKQTLNTIFEACDIYDDKTNSEGKDGKLNSSEWKAFMANVKEKLPKLLDSLRDYKFNEVANAITRAEIEKAAPADVTNVAQKIRPALVDLQSDNNKVQLKKPGRINKNSDIRSNYEWSEEAFNKVLSQMLDNPRYGSKFKNSVLRNQGKAFIEAGKKYNIDPRVLVSIAMVESERGISKKARELNNVGGLVINGKYHHFDTVAESIESIAKTVDTRYKEGYTTLEKIGNSGKYCEKSAASEWINHCSSYFKFFEKYYTADN